MSCVTRPCSLGHLTHPKGCFGVLILVIFVLELQPIVLRPSSHQSITDQEATEKTMSDLTLGGEQSGSLHAVLHVVKKCFLDPFIFMYFGSLSKRHFPPLIYVENRVRYQAVRLS